ncbi:MAG TPA: hypothetical protein VGL93_10505 [Streptosporangiaceae bacterium]|jgi:hypothetical protein
MQDQYEHIESTTPGAIIGHTRRGPIYLIAGGSGEGDGGGDNGGQGGDGGNAGGAEGGQSGADDQSTGQGGSAQGNGDAPAGPGGTGGSQGAANAGQAPNVGAGSGSDQGAGKDGDVASLPAWAQKLIKDTRAEAGNARTTAKAQAAQVATDDITQKLGKALGIIKDDEKAPTPDELAKQLADSQADGRSARVENAVFRAAITAGLDGDAVLDSKTFGKQFDGLDPKADDFAEKVAALITKAGENPKFKATAQAAAPEAPARTGGEFAGGSGDAAPKGEPSIDDLVAERTKKRDGHP